MDILTAIATVVLVLILVLYFPLIRSFLYKLMETAHSFADEYNSVYREDEAAEDREEQEDSTGKGKKKA